MSQGQEYPPIIQDSDSGTSGTSNFNAPPVKLTKEQIKNESFQDLLDSQLSKLKSAGVPIRTGNRTINAPHMNGTNREVHEGWLPEWIRNGFANYPIVIRSRGVEALQSIAKEMPAFVVGIGPSFDSQVNALRMAQKRAVIIATDAALRPLMRYGITPHLVISLDCKKKQHSLWADCPTENLTMLFHSCTSSDNIVTWKGKKLFFNIQQFDGDWHQVILPCVYSHLGQVSACGTVGNAGVLVANGMGCNPIMGVGMDFCYQDIGGKGYRYRTDDWKHIDGKWIWEEKPILYDNDERLATTFDVEIKGKKFKTDKQLEFYRKALLRFVGSSFINFVNCTPDGALAPDLKTMPVMEAIEEHCKRTFEPLESAVFHLNKILDDPVELWKMDKRLNSLDTWY